jgi:hypothetical protein
MRRLITALALLCMVPVALAQRPAELDFPLDHQRLQQGKMQTLKQAFQLEGVGERKVVIGVLLIDAPPERLWAVISHVEAQKAYVPNLERFETIFTKQARPGYRNILANVELDVPFVKVRYTLDMEIDHGARSLRWTLVDKEAARAYQKRDIPALHASGGLQSIVGRSFIEPYPPDPSKSLYYSVLLCELCADRHADTGFHRAHAHQKDVAQLYGLGEGPGGARHPPPGDRDGEAGGPLRGRACRPHSACRGGALPAPVQITPNRLCLPIRPVLGPIAAHGAR